MTNRREFLTQAGLLSAGALLAPQLLSAKPTAKAGLQLWTMRDYIGKDPKGVLAKVARAGYSYVEPYGYSKKGGFWGLSATDFSKTLKANGLTTVSGHYGMDQLFTDGSYGELDEAIEAAKITGQEYVVIPHLADKFRKTGADLELIAKRTNLAAERARKAGIKIGYHNHDFEFKPVDGKMLLNVLLKETDPSLVHFEMDIYWVVRAGQNPVKWVEQHPGRFTMLHVKDMDKANHDLNTEIGKGSINFKSLFAKAKVGGFKYYIVEQENFSIDPYVSITQSSKYLKNVLLA